MESFISRKKRKLSEEAERQANRTDMSNGADEELDTDVKLAILASILPSYDQEVLLDALISAEGSVEAAVSSLSDQTPTTEASPPAPKIRTIGYQSSLSRFRSDNSNTKQGAAKAKLTRKGQTLHLYSPEDIAAHTPCSIIHNFLPADEADALLRELLAEAPSFGRASFKIFDNIVQSPHTACFYVETLEERQTQTTEYLYNGSYLTDVRQILPRMRSVSARVKEVVNREITNRIQTHYPNQQKLKFQNPGEWLPNAAFVNCYTGGAESVGYHTDQLTYLGPRAIIGSISLGVAREFRVRMIVPPEDKDSESEPKKLRIGKQRAQADEQGQIAIHLPHNSLLVMHAEMQEEWKHSIAPAQSIDPHPIAGNKRINITYRHYREEFHPKYTPRCHCGLATVLRCVQRKQDTRGRYMWMCHSGQAAGKDGCSFFQWAEFDDDGSPPWAYDRKEANA